MMEIKFTLFGIRPSIVDSIVNIVTAMVLALGGDLITAVRAIPEDEALEVSDDQGD